MRRFAPVFLALIGSCSEPKVLREGPGWKETESAVQVTTDDPKLLADLARNHPDLRIRTIALAKISDPAVLSEIAQKETDPALRKKAVEGLDDVGLLEEISKNDTDPGVKEAAAARRDVLRIVAASHPEYRGWSARKPGSWVRMKVQLRIKEWNQTIEIERKLSSCRAERAVLEQRDRSTGKGVQGVFREVLTNYDLAVGRSEEDEAEFEMEGKRVKCHRTRWHFSRVRDIVHVSRWQLSSIPGGLARLDIEVAPEGEAQRVLVAWVTGWGE